MGQASFYLVHASKIFFLKILIDCCMGRVHNEAAAKPESFGFIEGTPVAIQGPPVNQLSPHTPDSACCQHPPNYEYVSVLNLYLTLKMGLLI